MTHCSKCGRELDFSKGLYALCGNCIPAPPSPPTEPAPETPEPTLAEIKAWWYERPRRILTAQLEDYFDALIRMAEGAEGTQQMCRDCSAEPAAFCVSCACGFVERERGGHPDWANKLCPTCKYRSSCEACPEYTEDA